MPKQQTLVGTWELYGFHLVPHSGITESFFFFFFPICIQMVCSRLLLAYFVQLLVGSRVTMFLFRLISTRKVPSYPPSQAMIFCPHFPLPPNPTTNLQKNTKKKIEASRAKFHNIFHMTLPPPLLFSKLSPPQVVMKCVTHYSYSSSTN